MPWCRAHIVLCGRWLIGGGTYQQARDIFLASLELSPEQRPVFLDRACEGNDPLRREVEALLSQHGEIGSFLDPPGRPGPGELEQGAAAVLPQRLGPYEPLRILGQGSMGIVYLARRCGLADTGDSPAQVALKVLRPELVSSKLQSRFRMEAEILSRLDHPGIARLFEAGVFDTPQGSRPYYAMAYVAGRPLSDFFAPAPGSPAAEATVSPPTAGPEVRGERSRATDRGRLRLLAEICEIVHYAHGQGVVHRDLKPANILVDETGRPRILDFGVARMIDLDARATTLMTTAGVLVGTLQYMSPEQAQASPDAIDARSDVYSLGVIGYELLTGRPPYEAPRDSIERALVAILKSEPAPAGDVATALRGNVERILAKALCKSRADRYQTAGDMAADIRRHLAGRPISLKAPHLGQRIVRTLRRLPRTAAVGLVVVVGLAVAFAAFTVYDARIRARAADPRRMETSLQEVYTCLDDAYRYLHRGGITHEGVQRGIAALEHARSLLAKMPAQRLTHGLLRFVSWRMGEGHIRLAGLDRNPDEIRTAIACWIGAEGRKLDPGAFAGMDSVPDLLEQVSRVGAHHPCAAIGNAYAELASYANPRGNLVLSRAYNESALKTLYDRTFPNYVPSNNAPLYRRQDLGMVWNDLAYSYASLGAVIDSLPLIDRALALLAQADTVQVLREYASVQGSIQTHYGLAWLERAERTRSLADVDSARTRLEGARALRGGAATRGGASVSVDLARVSLLDASLRSRPEVRRQILDRAAADLDLALRSLLPDESAREIAEIHLRTAEVLAERVRAGAGGEGLGRADSLLTASAGLVALGRHVLHHAALERVRGKVERIRWEVTADLGARERASAAIRRARDILPRDQDPHFHRVLDEEAVLLGAAPTP